MTKAILLAPVVLIGSAAFGPSIPSASAADAVKKERCERNAMLMLYKGEQKTKYMQECLAEKEEPEGGAATLRPFGMDETAAPESSSVWQEWKKVIAAADVEIQKLEKCRAEKNCNVAENKYSAIVQEARPKEPYPKVDFVQVRINHEIHYVSDGTQWKQLDRWSLPIDSEGKGSLNTGVGDCEDYVIAKYLVLLDSLYPYKSMRILLVRDNFVRQDHAVLAVNNDGKWLILDNRWDRLYEDKHLKQFQPLMSVDAEGVHYLNKMFRISDSYDP